MSGPRKRSLLSEDSLYRDLPPTKTVWGLTKEEIEMCSYLFQLLAVLNLIIGFLDFSAHVVASNNDKTHTYLSLALFTLSIIPMSLGLYGVYKENVWSLVLFLVICSLMFVGYAIVIVFQEYPIGMHSDSPMNHSELTFTTPKLCYQIW